MNLQINIIYFISTITILVFTQISNSTSMPSTQNYNDENDHQETTYTQSLITISGGDGDDNYDGDVIIEGLLDEESSNNNNNGQQQNVGDSRGPIGDIEKLKKIGEILKVVGDKVIPVLIQGGQTVIQNAQQQQQQHQWSTNPGAIPQNVYDPVEDRNNKSIKILQLLGSYKKDVDDMIEK